MRLGARRAGGFTILQLALALLVLSIIAAISIPAYFARVEVSLENATRLVVDDLRLAQGRAYGDHIAVDVRFLAGGLGYRVVRGGTDTELSDFDERRFDDGAVFEGIRVFLASPSARDVIEFDDRGMPRANSKITLEYRGEVRVVDIDAELGLVRLDDSRER